jgi:demethylmenaquinone methyltransferase/2-methoxy-6-polyprenyl-1,4-benzoquinol methylase
MLTIRSCAFNRSGFSITAVSPTAGKHHIDWLLAEQLAYYRAIAPEYLDLGIPGLSDEERAMAQRELLKALHAFRPSGAVLELACGPGTWTLELLRYAASVTAVDAAPEMLEIAASRIRDERVRFVQADLFEWEPDSRYDNVFFGFWLSHVPIERFERFWSLVGRCLKPDGRVAFVDDGHRTPDELIDGEQSATIRRRLLDGTAFRAVKVPHTPEELRARLEKLGWRITVTTLAGPFFWGEGSRLQR